MLDEYFFQLSLKISSRNHDTVGTTRAFDPNIHSHPNDFPSVFTARVRLLHFNNIIQAKVFIRQDPSPLSIDCFIHCTKKIRIRATAALKMSIILFSISLIQGKEEDIPANKDLRARKWDTKWRLNLKSRLS